MLTTEGPMWYLCSHCYRRRLRARATASGAAAFVQLQLAAQMVPKPVLPQTASMEGQPRECPVRSVRSAMQPPDQPALPVTCRSTPAVNTGSEGGSSKVVIQECRCHAWQANHWDRTQNDHFCFDERYCCNCR